jgi:hypothetical protein
LIFQKLPNLLTVGKMESNATLLLSLGSGLSVAGIMVNISNKCGNELLNKNGGNGCKLWSKAQKAGKDERDSCTFFDFGRALKACHFKWGSASKPVTRP